MRTPRTLLVDDADEPRFTVRVAAQRVGVPTATLRSWNQRYGVGPPAHSPGRHRLYSENDITAVQHMHDLICQGTSPRSAARLANDSLTPPHGDVESLLSAAHALDLVTLGRFLEAHLRHFGVVDTWDLVIRPAFAAIVAEQDAGDGCFDVEHALSWTVSRSLQRLPIVPLDASASTMLACTSSESHALPLEALRAALGEQGHGVLMLGAEVPQSGLTDAAGRMQPPVIALLWSQTADTADMNTVRALAAHAEVLLGGPGWHHVPDVQPAMRVHSLREAVARCVPDA